jgi:hypothetical protein
MINEPQQFSNSLKPLPGHVYNILSTAKKMSRPLFLNSLVAMKTTCLSAESLLGSGCCIVAYFMDIAQQWVH